MKKLWLSSAIQWRFQDSAILCVEQLQSMGADVSLTQDATALTGAVFEPEYAKVIHGFGYGSFDIKSIEADQDGAHGWIKLFDAEGQEIASVDLGDLLAGLVTKPKETVLLRIDCDHPFFDGTPLGELRENLQNKLDSGQATLEEIKAEIDALDTEESREVHEYSLESHINEVNNYDPNDYYIRLQVS